jgi:hypothetical protein
MKKIMLSMSIVAIALGSLFIACKKVDSKKTIEDKVEILNTSSSGQKVLAPVAMMNIGSSPGSPTYLGGATLKVYLSYCNAICDENTYGEIKIFSSSFGGYLPTGGYSNQTANGFNVNGSCTSNTAACTFITGASSGSWGPFYYLKSSSNSTSGATKILKVQFKQGLPPGSIGTNSFPTFNFEHSTNVWTNTIGTVLTPFINWSVINPSTYPACNCAVIINPIEKD